MRSPSPSRLYALLRWCGLLFCALLATTARLAAAETSSHLTRVAQGVVEVPHVALPQPTAAIKTVLDPRRAVREGIAVEFTMDHLHPHPTPKAPLQEGDDIVFRFALSDTATGMPLASVYPAAWLDRRPAQEILTAARCTRKAEVLIGGSLFSQPELDLNAYYVMTLNEDATLTVVDPLFGFGGSKLLALVVLQSPGEDWALTADQSHLFVSMPESQQVAVVETGSWKVVTNLKSGPHPSRLALQPDEHYLWVSHRTAGTDRTGVTVFNTVDLKQVADIATGKGSHDIAFSDDNRFVFVSNSLDGTVSIIDIRTLALIKDIHTGQKPVSIAWSNAASALFIADEAAGTIAVLDSKRHEIVARMQAEPGLGQIKFAPGHRLGFVTNPEADAVYILDAATNRIVQTAKVDSEPDQVAFSDELAYVRHRNSEHILMIPLAESGIEGRPVTVIDFPGGDQPPGRLSRPTPAAGMVQAPGLNAILVANAPDQSIYFYKEGMAAPMGEFQNYGREPRAVLVVDRSLRQHTTPGVYETVARLRRPGLYDLVFFLDTPRTVHCFEVAVAANPVLEQQRNAGRIDIQPLVTKSMVQAGHPVRLRFKLTDFNTKLPKAGLQDVQILALRAPGVWHQRQQAQEDSEGIYAIDFVPPQSGVYYAHVASDSLGIDFNSPQFIILRVADPPAP